MNFPSLVTKVRSGLEAKLRDLPDRFHSSFNYVSTGKNLCHPITLGIIAEVVRSLRGVRYIGVDVHLNSNKGHKFQPDIVGYDSNLEPIIFVDFESPNSCDTRIPEKDVRQYLNWLGHHPKAAPYIIVTSLPKHETRDWQLRYVNGPNGQYRARRAELKKSPFRFWHGVWSNSDLPRRLPKIAFLNINDKTVEPFSMRASKK
jgi:hypothetical protein